MSGIDKIKIGLTGIAANALSDLINSKTVTTDTTSKEESTISKIEVDNIDVSKTIQETSLAMDKTSYTSEEIDAMVKNYKSELQDQLKEYNELLNYVEKELKPLDDVRALLNELYINYEAFANQTEGDVTEIALTYKNVYCSEEKLKELGLTYEELQNIELNKLIEICKEKDPDIIEKYKAIESYKTEILDKKVAEETEFKTYEEYKEYRDALESDQVILKSAIRKIKQEIECAEYNFLTLSEEYQNYSYDGTKGVSPLEELRTSKESFFGSLKFMENKKELENLLVASEMNPELSKMYNYLYEKEGLESATEYLTKMEDTINQEVGKKQAEAFLMKLEEEEKAADVITNHLKVAGKGLVDGTESFAGGVAAWFTGSEVYTIDEYESMYILQALQNEEKYDFLLDNNYEISQSIGNMLPSIALSVALTPAAGATVAQTAGTISMGVSAGGNSYHSALVEGQDPSKAILYGVLSGVSEATLERMLGGIPGLSDVNVTGLKTFAQAMLQEGIEEGTQEYLDALMRAGLFGEEIDIEEVTKNAGKSAIYGSITAGIMNTPSLTINSINSINSKNDIDVTEKLVNLTEKLDTDMDTTEELDTISMSEEDLNNTVEEIEVERVKDCENRVFETEGGMALGKNNPISLHTNSNFAYRITGMSQIVDIVDCGYVRTKGYGPRAARVGQVVYWSRGSECLYYYDTTRAILEASMDKVDGGKIGALSIDDLSAIWIFNKTNNQYENRLEDIKKIYQNKSEDMQITEEVLNDMLNNKNTESLNNRDVTEKLTNIDTEVDVTEKLTDITEKLDSSITEEIEITGKMPKYEPTEKIGQDGIIKDDITEKIVIPKLSDIYNGSIFNEDGSINYTSASHLISSKLDAFFSNFGDSYGTDQAALNQLYRYTRDDSIGNLIDESIVKYVNPRITKITGKLGNTKYFELKQKLTNKGFSKRDASVILSGVNNEGACTYAAFANEIFATFNEKAEAFESYFGFPMYYTNESGKLSLNTEELLLDIYLYENDVANGGKLFEDNKVVSFNPFEGDIFDRPTLNAENQVYLSNSAGRNDSKIKQYLNSKGLEYDSVSTVFGGSFEESFKSKISRIFSDSDNYISDDTILSIKKSVEDIINNGKSQVSLGIYSRGKEIRMISLEDPIHYTTNTWNEGSGHAVFVTAVTDDGFIVSSWGQRYLIPFVDLQKGGNFTLIESEIYPLNNQEVDE